MPEITLPQRIYPAFASIAHALTVDFSRGSGQAIYRMSTVRGSGPENAMIRRALQPIIQHGLMKKRLDGDHEFTTVGYALAVAIRKTGHHTSFDLFTFLNSLSEDVLVGFLSLPANQKPWWSNVFLDLGLCYVRPRTDKIDQALQLGTVLEFLSTSPITPPPSHLREPPARRAPDLARFEAIKKACEVVWAGKADQADAEFYAIADAAAEERRMEEAADFDFFADTADEEFGL